MKDHYCVLKAMVVLVALSMMSVTPINSSKIIAHLLTSPWNNHTRIPTTKYEQLFNKATSAYVRISNHIVDSTTTNDTDPDTFLKISMYGPELLTLQSYQTDEYICYNNATGLIEVKLVSNVTNHRGCYFYKRSNNNSYHSYKTFLKKDWYLAFHGKGGKTGRPKKGRSTNFSKSASMFKDNPLTISRRRANG